MTPSPTGFITTSQPPSRRPRPVLIYAATMAGLTTLTGYAGLDQLIPSQAVLWLALVTLVVGSVGGVLVQGQVTPVSDPRDQYGRRLVPPSPGGRLAGDVGPGR